MSATSPTKTVAYEGGETSQILDEILREMRQREIREPPATLSGLTLSNAQEAIVAIEALQEASIKLTQPTDWVLFHAKDGADVCYLQDSGCERIRGLWGIDFDRVKLREDVIDRMTEDGHFVAEVIVRSRCKLTGETNEELGFRASAGFFGPEWEKVTKAQSFVEMERLKANIRKSAIVNGKGRCIRTVTGMAQMPLSRLKVIFGDRIREIRDPGKSGGFQSGTKGGSGDYASDPQLKKLTFEARAKVLGLEKAGDFEAIKSKLAAANLTKKRASELIEGFVKRTDEDEPIDIETFQKMTGTKFVEDGGE